MTNKEIVELLCELVDLKESTNRGLILKDINNFQGQLEKDLKVLEQYKKIENEIGIDFITLYKAVKNGIYTKYDGEVKKEVKTISYNKDVMVHYGNKSKIGAIIIFYGDYNSQYCDLTDAYSYGEYWALTREELEQ